MTMHVHPITQRIVPMIVYDDAPAALAFLCRAFGFVEPYERYELPDGRIGHAEVTFEGGRVMVASSTDGDEAAGVPRLRPPGAAESHDVQLRVYVDDVDAHHARAVSEGATIVVPPADQPYGERVYRAADLEGYRWLFAQPLPHDD